MLVKKSLVGYCMISLLAINTIYQHQSVMTTQAAFQTYQNPGMQLRLEQSSMDAMKKAMQQFLPHYLNSDLNLPTEYELKFSLCDFLSWHFQWTNI